MQHCKAQVTALEPMVACSSVARHEAQASRHHRLLLLPQPPQPSQPHAVKACLVRRILVLISLVHALATTVRHDLDATKSAPSQDNEEAGTRVASAEETMSLREELHNRLWMTAETTHAARRGEAVMTAVVEMEDIGVAQESRNKAAVRYRTHQDRSAVVRRKYRHHHQARLRDLHQIGSVARHATTVHLSTTGAAAGLVNSEAEEAADVRTTGAEVGDLAARKT